MGKQKLSPVFARARRQQRVSDRLRDNGFHLVLEPGQAFLLLDFSVDRFSAPFQRSQRHPATTIRKIRVDPLRGHERISLALERRPGREPAGALRERRIPPRGFEAAGGVAGRRMLPAVVGGRDAVALARGATPVERLSELPRDLGSRLAAQPLGSGGRRLDKLLALLHSSALFS